MKGYFPRSAKRVKGAWRRCYIKEGHAERALELAAFVLEQAESEQEAKDRAQGIVERASMALDANADVSAAARERGRVRMVEDVVKGLLRG